MSSELRLLCPPALISHKHVSCSNRFFCFINGIIRCANYCHIPADGYGSAKFVALLSMAGYPFILLYPMSTFSFKNISGTHFVVSVSLCANDNCIFIFSDRNRISEKSIGACVTGSQLNRRLPIGTVACKNISCTSIIVIFGRTNNYGITPDSDCVSKPISLLVSKLILFLPTASITYKNISSTATIMIGCPNHNCVVTNSHRLTKATGDLSVRAEESGLLSPTLCGADKNIGRPGLVVFSRCANDCGISVDSYGISELECLGIIGHEFGLCDGCP